MTFGEEMDVLERQIKQLQIEWEKFFGGVERKPPVDLRARVEAQIRKFANAEIRNNTERFRYFSLTSRYNTFSELWSKRLRALEEGRPMGLHGVHAHGPSAFQPAPPTGEITPDANALAALAASLPAVPRPPARPAAPAPTTGEYRVHGAQGDGSAVQSLYRQFMDARKAAGETTAVKFDAFQKLISQQADRMRSERGAAAVDFRIETKDGKVSLKAKPVK